MTRIHSADDLVSIENAVEQAAVTTLQSLRGKIQESPSLATFSAMKFDKVGRHPLGNRALNLIEQLNQTFTILASVRATRWLLARHPENAPFVLNLGNRAGIDIESLDGKIACETFAAVTPSNNGKLAKDAAKLAALTHQWKYVFYACPAIAACEPRPSSAHPSVLVVSLGPLI